MKSVFHLGTIQHIWKSTLRLFQQLFQQFQQFGLLLEFSVVPHSSGTNSSVRIPAAAGTLSRWKGKLNQCKQMNSKAGNLSWSKRQTKTKKGGHSFVSHLQLSARAPGGVDISVTFYYQSLSFQGITFQATILLLTENDSLNSFVFSLQKSFLLKGTSAFHTFLFHFYMNFTLNLWGSKNLHDKMTRRFHGKQMSLTWKQDFLQYTLLPSFRHPGNLLTKPDSKQCEPHPESGRAGE